MQADLNWLTDSTVFQVNRLDAHSDHVCYASPGAPNPLPARWTSGGRGTTILPLG